MGPVSSLSTKGWVVLGVMIGLMMVVTPVSSKKFDELFQARWALDHFVYQGDTLRMKLDKLSGNLY